MNDTASTARYRTRPSEVDAIRWLGETNCEQVFAFLGWDHPDDELDHSAIHGIGDDQTAWPGDWILRTGPDWDDYRVMLDGEFQNKFEATDNHEPCTLTWAQSISTDNAGRTVDIPINHGGQFLGNVRVPFAEYKVLRDMLDGLVAEVQQEQAASRA